MQVVYSNTPEVHDLVECVRRLLILQRLSDVIVHSGLDLAISCTEMHLEVAHLSHWLMMERHYLSIFVAL